MAAVTLEWEARLALAALRKLADGLEMPTDASHPFVTAQRDHQVLLSRKYRPRVSSGGAFFAGYWPRLAPRRTRKDGTEVPVWPIPKARTVEVDAHTREAYTRSDGVRVSAAKVRSHTRKTGFSGMTLGAKKSSGVGAGTGSRYAATDAILGDRAGGLWSDWITQEPSVLSRSVVQLVSSFVYSARNFALRPWITPSLRERLGIRMRIRLLEYIRMRKKEAGYGE